MSSCDTTGTFKWTGSWYSVSAYFIPGSGHSIVLMHGNGRVASSAIIYTYVCTRQALKCKRYVVAFCMFFFYNLQNKYQELL